MRLLDQGSQTRVRAESRAVEEFFAFVFLGRVRWIVSEVLEAEILANPDSDMRSEALRLLHAAAERIVLTDDTFHRANVLERLGYGAFDALHLACAEQAKVDTLLTTDERFTRQAQRGLGKTAISVENPVNWRRGFTP
jgi:predicted nucleic acid-binding protein